MNPYHNSIEHLSLIIDKLNKKEGFGIIRPADGEYLVMTNRIFTNVDNWTFNGGSLRDDLLSIKDLIKNLDNMFIGIPCYECQGAGMVEWFINNLELNDNQLTYANIFCNKNWKKFTNYLIDTKLPLYYIGPGTKKDSQLNIVDIFNIDPYLVNNWDNQKSNFIDSIDKWVNNIQNNVSNPTFVFSAGPITKYIIPILFKKYPSCQFLDVGSSLDIFMKGVSNRGYINEKDMYANVVCNFKTGHKIDNEEYILNFIGGWSYSKEEMGELIKFIDFRDTYNILEFGAGVSSKNIYDIIKKYCYNINYDIYENDVSYKVEYKNINTILYNINEIDNIIIPDIKYDLILIDGPNGVLRSKWYSKIRNNIKNDTIILIDDYNHYKEFEIELNKNFTYTTLSMSNTQNKSWKILNNITLK